VNLLFAALLLLGQPAQPEVPACFYIVAAGGYTLPDAHCTPGAVVDIVTQDNVHETICVPGWVTANLPRPPTRQTNLLKRQQLAMYGRPDDPLSGYEEDHLVPIELGGSSDSRNLWPEPGASPNRKDAVENAARRAVCSDLVSLPDAQAWMAGNWPDFADWLGVP